MIYYFPSNFLCSYWIVSIEKYLGAASPSRWLYASGILESVELGWWTYMARTVECRCGCWEFGLYKEGFVCVEAAHPNSKISVFAAPKPMCQECLIVWCCCRDNCETMNLYHWHSGGCGEWVLLSGLWQDWDLAHHPLEVIPEFSARRPVYPWILMTWLASLPKLVVSWLWSRADKLTWLWDMGIRKDIFR